MPYSEAKKKATIKYQKKTYDRIELKVKKGEKEKIKASRDNYAGDYVTAESEAEAIELYKDFLIEQIRNNNLNAEIIDDEIVVTDDEENEVERFINFEIED